jgi:hypothetical protein
VRRVLESVAARLRSESGLALIVAIFVTALMLGIGLALLSFADQQTGQTGRERVKENALALTEGALNATSNLLSGAWPGAASAAFAACTQASTTVNCPDPGNLIRGFTNKDFGSNGSAATWSITVRDNALGSFYDDAATAAQAAYDANLDGTVWLRVRATVRGETRTVVALVRAMPMASTFPRGVITAGHFSTSNNGNKVIVDTGAGPGIVARCNAGAGGPARGNSCLDYVVTKGQVWPNLWKADPATPNAMAASDIAAMRARAKAAGTWYSSCPSTIPSGPLVFVENGPCSLGSNTQVNSALVPGMLVINSGTMSLGGTSNFYGIIYAVNAGGLAGDVVSLGGNSQVQGSIVVDGAGGVSAGSSKVNVIADPNVFNLVTTTQTITLIANSWRELNGP